MKLLLASAFATLLPSTTIASPAPQSLSGTKEIPLRFTAISQGPSGTPLNAGIIAANNIAFFIGKPTTTACEPNADPLSAICDENTKNNNQTIFSYVNGEGRISLDVNVKGGQAVFVNGADGKLGFTRGWDWGKTPEGAVVVGFANVYDATLEFEKKGWWACHEGEGVWGIYAQSRRQEGSGCQAFTFKLQQVKARVDGGPATAWQYV